MIYYDKRTKNGCERKQRRIIVKKKEVFQEINI